MRTRSSALSVLSVLTALALGLTAGVPATASVAPAARDLPAPTRTTPYDVEHPPSGATPVVTGLRTGRHATFDRFVVDLRGGRTGYRVRYVRALVADGSGATVPLKGEAVLAITLRTADAHVGSRPTVPRSGTPALPALKQWKIASDFEGQVEIGLGLADRVGFRVLELRRPERLVVDVAHPLPPPTRTSPRTLASLAQGKSHLTAVSTARHPGWDRTVFTFRERSPGVDVRYVPRLVQDGSGHVLPVDGRAVLQVRFDPATSYDERTGRRTWAGPDSSRPRLPAVRHVRLAGDFEAGLTFGLGVAQRGKGFRVLRLENPTRVAVDVAH